MPWLAFESVAGRTETDSRIVNMDDPTIIFRVHAVKQMLARGISEVEVRAILEDGETVQESPDDLL